MSICPATTVLALALLAASGTSLAQSAACSVQSAATVTPVLELYTSEGCSSCPPADKWLSTFKDKAPYASGGAVIQAFHVGYWDHIGWVDRFAAPANTSRQRQIAAWNGQRSIYTPQAVLNGADWRGWWNNQPPTSTATAPAHITLKRLAPDHFEAVVLPRHGAPATWSAYWTITEHGHTSKVKAGENAGAALAHDFVVRQYTPAGDYRTDIDHPQTLTLRSIAATPGHPRQVNLVVFDPKNGRTLQAVSANC